MFNAGFCNSALASKPASNNSGEGAGVLGLDKYPANSAEGAVQQRGQENFVGSKCYGPDDAASLHVLVPSKTSTWCNLP